MSNHFQNNIKMKPLIPLFKKRIMKLYVFLKAKSQAKAFQHRCMLFA